jgi:RimJ/RimL family protein N-acetyltransferase
MTSMDSSWQPTLEGQLIRVRPLTPSDWPALFSVASDPLIWEQHPAHDRHREDVFRRYFDDALASGGAVVVIDRACGAVIGASRFHDGDAGTGEVEIGWTFLGRAYWGGAVNRELKRLMLQYAFTRVNAVVFLIHPDNVRSQRATEKIGARLAGSRKDAAGRESLVYRITADEFLAAAPWQCG